MIKQAKKLPSLLNLLLAVMLAAAFFSVAVTPAVAQPTTVEVEDATVTVGDSGSVEQHKLIDQIEADKYLASKAASRRPGWPLRLFKLSAPGAR